MTSLVDNERTKLISAALDRASTSCFTVGIATPLAGYLYNVANFRGTADPVAFVIGLGGWMFGAVALHYLAKRTLKRLK